MGDLDWRIIGGGMRPMQLDDPLDVERKRVSILAGRQSIEASKRKLDNDPDEILKAAAKEATDASGNLDRGKFKKVLFQKAPALGIKMESADIDTDMKRLKKADGDLDFLMRVRGSVTDQASHERALKYLDANGFGDIARQVGPEYDPKTYQMFDGMALDAKEKIKQQWEQKKYNQRERFHADQIGVQRDRNRGAVDSSGNIVPKPMTEAQAEQAKFRREQAAQKNLQVAQKNDIEWAKDTSAYKSASAALDETESAVQAALEAADKVGAFGHTGIEGDSGELGALWNAPGSVSSNFAVKMKRVGSIGMLDALMELKSRGGTLGALSASEGEVLKSAASDIDKAQDAVSRKAAIQAYLRKVKAAKERLAEAFQLQATARRAPMRDSVAPADDLDSASTETAGAAPRPAPPPATPAPPPADDNTATWEDVQATMDAEGWTEAQTLKFLQKNGWTLPGRAP